MMTAIVFFLILSILVVFHELGHFLAAKKNGVLVEEFGFGLPPRIFGIKIGETLFSLNWLPFGGFVKVLGEEQHEIDKHKLTDDLKNRTFVSKSPLAKLSILTAGVVANFILGWIIMTYLFTTGVPVPTDKVVVKEVAKRSPAANAGIKTDDTFKALVVDGKRIDISNTEDFINQVKKVLNIKTEFIIERQSVEQIVTMTPRANPPKNEGSLGVVLATFITKKYPVYQAPFAALIESVKTTGLIIRELAKIPLKLIMFQKPDVDVTGPIGIAKITSQAIGFGHIAVLQLLGLLSLNLGVINILPFPALDGGRVMFVLYEIVRKKPIDSTLEKKLNMAGFVILLSLIIIVTIGDIIKFF